MRWFPRLGLSPGEQVGGGCASRRGPVRRAIVERYA
jgi:hypothetical protein